MKKTTKGLAWSGVVGALVIIAAGCGGGSASAPVATGIPAQTPTTLSTTGASSSAFPDKEVSSVVDAGFQAQQTPNPQMMVASINKAATKYGAPRSDPFALQPAERAFDVDQTTERVFGEIGEFQNVFTPTVRAEPPPIILQPQPYRRLAGIVVGDSIVALITMEDNQSFIIYPGAQLPAPYQEWTVKSIDMDQAVLSRKVGNPHEVTVRLESAPEGGATGAPPMGNQGGPPGGPPGGGRFPGMPPGAGGFRGGK